RKIADTTNISEINSLRAEFADRFGTLPPTVERLFKITELRITAFENNIQYIEVRDGKVMFMRNNQYIKQNSRFPRLKANTVDKRLDAMLDLVRSFPQ
ncbi:MAG: hypothetical protein JXN60_06740, partial [Lentisphaerae bacterium]|nr:hypothetical protein [Lentisphaerota bacterium]